MNKYSLVVCGGTFDLFHKGHQEFLKFVVSQGEKALIGITSDSYIDKNKKSGEVQSYQVREKEVLELLNTISDKSHFEIQPINDLFGPTLDRNLVIDALIVTQETKKGAEIINQKRKENNLSELKVLIAPFVKAEDGKTISSTRIRNGEINREGKLYIKPEWFSKTFLLPENKRYIFKEAFGEIVVDLKTWIQNQKIDPKKVISVGDETTKNLNSLNFQQQFSIIDFKIARKEEFSKLEELGFTGQEKVQIIDSPAGSISGNLIKSIQEMFLIHDKQIIRVNGEEDLAVLPVILAAPLGFTVFYGQPGKGVVKVEVTEDAKEKAYRNFTEFTHS